MKKRKIDTMQDFEQIVNYYLTNDLPFSLLEEEYDLYLKQRGFMLNRILDYEGKVEELQNNYEDINTTYLNLPHSIEEKTPLAHDELMNLFKEKEELKTKIRMMQNRINTNDYDEKLKEFNEKEIEIAKDVCYRIDFSEEDTTLNRKALEYYKDLYSKYLLITKNKRSYIDKVLETDQDYQTLISKLASVNDELVYRNIKLANWVIRLYFKRMPFDMEEMQGYALEGLAKAINSFDYKRGTHFSSYAALVIKRNIQANFINLVGVSWYNYLLGLNYKRYLEEYSNITGEKNVTTLDLYNSNLFGLSLSELQKSEKYANIVTIPFTYLLSKDPLDLLESKSATYKTFDDYEKIDAYEDEYNTTLNLATENNEISVYAENKILEETLRTLLDILPDDEKKIIRKRYGFDDGKYRSLDQVAKELNVTKDKVYHVEKRILRFLRHPLQAKLLCDFYLEQDLYDNNKPNTYRGL